MGEAKYVYSTLRKCVSVEAENKWVDSFDIWRKWNGMMFIVLTLIVLLKLSRDLFT